MGHEAFGFLVVGCGMIGKTHVEQILQLPDAYLAGVVDEVPARADAFGAQYGVPAYASLTDALARDDVHIVTIGTPSGLHAEATIAAARAGKHVVVEKPIEVSLAKADAMIAACREHNVKLAVISQHRFDRATIAVKRRVDAGDMGRMLLGEAAVNWYRSQGYYDSGAWRGTWEFDGGGALMNQSIHTIDLLQHVMGPVDTVFAYAGTLAHERIEVEDVAAAVVRFQSGAMATIVGTTVAYPSLSARLEVFGERGSAVIEHDRLTHLYIKDQERSGANYGDHEAVNLASDALAALSDGDAVTDAWGMAHRAQFLDLMAAIREDREPLVNGEEGRKPLAIILAIYESAKTGKEVKVSS